MLDSLATKLRVYLCDTLKLPFRVEAADGGVLVVGPNGDRHIWMDSDALMLWQALSRDYDKPLSRGEEARLKALYPTGIPKSEYWASDDIASRKMG